jgi:hypothetical protein
MEGGAPATPFALPEAAFDQDHEHDQDQDV